MLYFEKQGMLSTKCAIHAVNNLLGANIYDQKSFDQICKYLSQQSKKNGFQVSNKHFLAADYDANVIIKVLNQYGLQSKWIDSRKQFKLQNQQNTVLKGYIINMELQKGYMHNVFNLSGRHWVCVKLQGTSFYYLDSKCKEPIYLKDIQRQLNAYIQNGFEVIQVKKRIQFEKSQQEKEICKQLNQNGQQAIQQNSKQQYNSDLESKFCKKSNISMIVDDDFSSEKNEEQNQCEKQASIKQDQSNYINRENESNDQLKYKKQSFIDQSALKDKHQQKLQQLKVDQQQQRQDKNKQIKEENQNVSSILNTLSSILAQSTFQQLIQQ